MFSSIVSTLYIYIYIYTYVYFEHGEVEKSQYQDTVQLMSVEKIDVILHHEKEVG